MQSLSQLERNAITQPNSSEIKQALAEAYAREERWEDAANVYRNLASLYPDTAALFINRIRLGAWALMISSALFFSGELLQPAMDSTGKLFDFAQAISSSQFLVAQILFLLAFALYSCSAISIYKLLSYTRDHRPAFWAMVLNVIGIGLSMPALGIKAVVLPLIGDLYLGGKTDAMPLYFAMQQNPSRFLLGFGSYLLVAGIAIFAWVIWRNKTLSLASSLVYLSGCVAFALTDNQHLKPTLLLIGMLIFIGGIGLGRSLWVRAQTQFDPNMDRSSKT